LTPDFQAGLKEGYEAKNIAVERPINEYPFFKARLGPIDYKGIIAEKKRWEDPHFAHDKTSLFDPDLKITEEHKKWERYEWKRASDVYPMESLKIFSGITPTDIVQGFCGDCYFLSSISSLAEYPERVEDIFLTKEINEAGCYAMKFYINGQPETVVVDDYFPWHPIL
jgi:hypothetical protein